jgi:predicted dithiol-disulfide oxidoreductase (DUF899 family)
MYLGRGVAGRKGSRRRRADRVRREEASLYGPAETHTRHTKTQDPRRITMNTPKTATAAEWLRARTALLSKEKELTRQHDELAKLRRELPWVRVEKDYVFHGPSGEQTLAELFRGQSQLIVYHFMLGPGWKDGCPSCSFFADHLDGTLVHLAARDVAFTAVSRAPYAELAPFKQRMGWRFPWVSSHATQFNRDFHVSFTQAEVASGDPVYNYGLSGFRSEEAPGISVFAKDDAGSVFHTYSTYGRGPESAMAAYQLLDLVPKGRDEAGLPWPMAWVRHHDKYGAVAAE